MSSGGKRGLSLRSLPRTLRLLLITVAILAQRGDTTGQIPGNPPLLRQIRMIEADDVGSPGLSGVPYPPGTPLRIKLDEPPPIPRRS